MSFTAAVFTTCNPKTVMGDRRVVYGSYTNTGGSTGGDVTTGLARCDFFTIQPGDAAVNTNAPTVNETLPLAGGVVTIVTDANAIGFWKAEGI